MSCFRWVRAVAALPLGSVLFAGCANPPDGVTFRAVGALAATPSAPIDVETWSNDANAALALASSHDLACNASGCLALYTLSLPFRTPATYLYGTRLDAAAAPLDSPRLFYGPASGFGGLAAFGADFLAVWTVPGSGAHAARLDGTTGAVVQDLTSLLPAGSGHRVYSGIAGALLTYDSGGTTYALVLDAATPAAVGSPIALPASGPAVAASPGQFLLAWSQRFMRIDATAGAALDATPLVYTQYYPGAPQAVYVGGVYQLAWELQDSIYAARIRPSDGVVLDADTSAAPGAKQICDQCIGDFVCDAPEQQTLGMGATGKLAYVTWLSLTNGCGATSAFHGFAIDPSTGLGGDGFNIAYQGGGFNDGNHNAVAQPTFRTSSTGALVLLDQAFAQVPRVIAGSNALAAGTVQQIVKTLPTRGRVRVVASKGQYLVGWQTTTTTVGGPLAAARIDAASASVWTPPRWPSTTTPCTRGSSRARPTGPTTCWPIRSSTTPSRAGSSATTGPSASSCPPRSTRISPPATRIRACWTSRWLTTGPSTCWPGRRRGSSSSTSHSSRSTPSAIHFRQGRTTSPRPSSR